MSQITKENCDPLQTATIANATPSSGRKRTRSSFEQIDTNTSPPLTSKQMQLETLVISNELLRDENAQLTSAKQHLEDAQSQLHSQIHSQKQRIHHLEEDVARMYRYQKKELLRVQNQYADQIQALQLQVENSNAPDLLEVSSIQQLACKSVALQQALSTCTQKWIQTQHKVETHSVMESLILSVERNHIMERQLGLQEERKAIHHDLQETQKDCEEFLMHQSTNWQEVSSLHETEKQTLEHQNHTLHQQIDVLKKNHCQAISMMESKLHTANDTILLQQTQLTQASARLKSMEQSLSETTASSIQLKTSMEEAHLQANEAINALQQKENSLLQSHNALLEKEEQLKTASAAVGQLHMEKQALTQKLDDNLLQKESLQTQLTLLSAPIRADDAHPLPSSAIANLIAEKLELESFIGRYIHASESKMGNSSF
uniref:AlNc14C52G4045 protein n=1 Tax=Albugo laibachii Nc14 TaxID=890382 RepID=F0WBK0_9STRA|nr:AlNc14C52G4045 [Albugo laibachii Nc14]|eukprot:CCA18527.1 AlNc14C52G4045 [Albugo laibachii Nc14]